MLEFEYSIFYSNISIELPLTILLFFISDWCAVFKLKPREYILILKIKYNTKENLKIELQPAFCEHQKEPSIKKFYHTIWNETLCWVLNKVEIEIDSASLPSGVRSKELLAEQSSPHKLSSSWSINYQQLPLFRTCLDCVWCSRAQRRRQETRRIPPDEQKFGSVRD